MSTARHSLPRRGAEPVAARGASPPLGRRHACSRPALCLVVAAPLMALLGFIGQPTQGLWAHLARTVLPEYVRNSAAALPGRRRRDAGGRRRAGVAGDDVPLSRPAAANWALVLPLAMPAYVLAYAYTDFLQVTGRCRPRCAKLTGWGWRDYWFPNVRSLGGAVFVLTAALYPYVYVLARAGFAEQSMCALEVSRTPGLHAVRRVPPGRPAPGPARHRRRPRLRHDGDAGRFRRRRLLRAAHLHDRDLPRLVRAGQPGRRGPAGLPAPAAGLRASWPLEWAARGRGRFATTPRTSSRSIDRAAPAGVAGPPVAPARCRSWSASSCPASCWPGWPRRRRRHRRRPAAHADRQHRPARRAGQRRDRAVAMRPC